MLTALCQRCLTSGASTEKTQRLWRMSKSTKEGRHPEVTEDGAVQDRWRPSKSAVNLICVSETDDDRSLAIKESLFEEALLIQKGLFILRAKGDAFQSTILPQC